MEICGFTDSMHRHKLVVRYHLQVSANEKEPRSTLSLRSARAAHRFAAWPIADPIDNVHVAVWDESVRVVDLQEEDGAKGGSCIEARRPPNVIFDAFETPEQYHKNLLKYYLYTKKRRNIYNNTHSHR